MARAHQSLWLIFLLTLTALAGCTSKPEVWHTERVLSGIPIHGMHGLAFGPDGGLYIGSVMGQSIIRVDTSTGTIREVIPAPAGEADDVAFSPDGSMAWTALNQGVLRVRKPNGEIMTVAAGLPFVNPVTFAPDGTLYAATLFGPDRLWAYDLKAGTSRVVTENLGGLNAFEFGDDGALYTPLPQKQSIGKINADTGALTTIAENVGNVVAVKFHPDGFLYGVTWDDGQIVQVDTRTGTHKVIATLEPPLDNLAVSDAGQIYVTRSADNGLVVVNPIDGSNRVFIRSDLAAPGGMTWMKRNGKLQLLVTDIFGYRFVDPETGETEILPFDLEGGASADAGHRDGRFALSYVRRNRVLLKDSESNTTLQTWTNISTPYGVLIEPNGTVLVVSHNDGTLVRLNANNPDQRQVIANQLAGPVGLAWAEDGVSVYIVESESGEITKATLKNGTRQSIATDLDDPESIALLPDGRLVVAEVGAHRVSAIDPNTGDKTVLAQDLAIGGRISRTPDRVGMPTGLAADINGDVYVITDAENGLLKLTQTPN